MFTHAVLSFLSRPGFKGVLTLTYRGRTWSFGDPAAADGVLVARADIQVKSPAFFRDVSLFGQTGFGKAYFDEEFETSDLKGLLLWFLQNRQMIPGFESNPRSSHLINWASGLQWLAHRLRKNTRAGSRRNIRAHYDLSNEFYALWLDPTMTYSSAVFADGADDDLRAAQERKYRMMCEKSGIGSGDHVLEIGCGWGGFACFAARAYGCRVTATTISEAQYAYAAERIKREGVEDKVTLIRRDYRDLEGSFDKIVSIEMMEALGHEHVRGFLQKCRDLLKPGGTLCFQCITVPDENFDRYLASNDFIKEYIFPGAELLAMGRVTADAASLGFTVESVERIGLSYARTLHLWSERFLQVKEQVKQMGFDERFCRKWLFYLVCCEAGFQVGIIDDQQVLMRRS